MMHKEVLVEQLCLNFFICFFYEADLEVTIALRIDGYAVHNQNTSLRKLEEFDLIETDTLVFKVSYYCFYVFSALIVLFVVFSFGILNLASKEILA